jgi:hypothetical protein
MPKTIEGQPVYGFIDHDYEKVKNFSIYGKIDWFEYRFNKILMNPIQIIDETVKKAKDADNECFLENENVSVFTIIVLTICVGIDLLGGFLSGRNNDNKKGIIRKDFINFIDEYLDLSKEYAKRPYKDQETFSSLLYELFRCGLAHNLTIKKVGFGYGQIYFREEDGNYYISTDKLLEDLKQAFENYILNIRENKNGLQQKFMSRFDHVFIKRE